MSLEELFARLHAERAPAGPVTHIVAGLGNPGKEYENTRHNMGFGALDVIAQSAGVRVDRLKFHALTAEATVGGVRVLLMKPQTYMNASGIALKEAAAFYKIAPENVIVLCDDISFDVGHLRVRTKGSAGGHNGLKSIIAELGSENFPRVKLGVGQKPHPDYDLADWVLGRMTESDRAKCPEVWTRALTAVRLLLAGKAEEAMNTCNG